jgi:hypothetical protein
MFSSRKINEKQMTLVNAFIAYFKHVHILTNNQLHEAHLALYQHKFSPYFIYRNDVCKTKDHKFDLSRLHCDTLANVSSSSSSEVKTAVKRAKRAKRESTARVEDTSRAAIAQSDVTALQIEQSNDTALSTFEETLQTS